MDVLQISNLLREGHQMTCLGSRGKVAVELELESRSPIWSSSCQLGTGTGVPSRLLDAAGDTSHWGKRPSTCVAPGTAWICSALDTLCHLGQFTSLWPSVHHLTNSLASVVLNFLTTKNPVIFPLYGYMFWNISTTKQADWSMAICHLLPLPFFTFIEDGALKQQEEARAYVRVLVLFYFWQSFFIFETLNPISHLKVKTEFTCWRAIWFS